MPRLGRFTPLYRRPNGLQGRSRRVRKISPYRDSKPPSVKPKTIRYTMGLQPYYGKGPHQLLRAGSRAARGNIRGGADTFLARPGRKKLQRPNSGFIQHTPHEGQYTS